jgi:antitoxin component YwqK of YwqJK toxin-antitoxin module
MARVLVLFFFLVLLGCQLRRARPELEAEPTVVHETRRSYHPGRVNIRMEYRVAVWSDGRIERDGVEHEFYSDGVLRAERHFAGDLPTGVWKSWYPDGALRSEVDFGGGEEPRPMRFWYPNGELEAEGSGIRGVREGRWSYWSEAGTLEREGTFQDGLREGTWTFRDEAGRKREEGVYVRGERVGVWSFWDEDGNLTVRREEEVPRQASETAPGDPREDQ